MYESRMKPFVRDPTLRNRTLLRTRENTLCDDSPRDLKTILLLRNSSLFAIRISIVFTDESYERRICEFESLFRCISRLRDFFDTKSRSNRGFDQMELRLILGTYRAHRNKCGDTGLTGSVVCSRTKLLLNAALYSP
ncbi:hypothetical protein V1478_013458 [Vespula squamosa]|uniref:Uncharacterized protein n=1 Tax=Vespula squamosa TaxID=30214 RepID=A0ABD2AAX3_VESSQ